MRRSSSWHRLCSSTAVLAMTVAGATAPISALHAQTVGGFQGNPTFDRTRVQIDRGSNTDTITVSAPTAVINWAPYDTSTNTGTPVNFLPEGFTGNFVGPSAFTVVNRILPADASRPAQFNGTVNSIVSEAQGGSVWFVSPAGIVAGSGSVFNVGSLLLASGDIAVQGQDFDANTARFTNSEGSTARVLLQGPRPIPSSTNVTPGARINATGNVALVAPRVEQAGLVRADGSIAYVAGEAGTVSFPVSGGLYSVAIDPGRGTTVAQAITHDGDSGGAAPTPNPSGFPVAPGQVVFNAVAKNDAVAMLLRGNIGFDPGEVTVTQNGDSIVIAAGRAVTNGFSVATGVGEPVVNVGITDVAFRNDVDVDSNGSVSVSVTGGGSAGSDGSMTLRGNTAVSVNVAGDGSFNVADDLYLFTGNEDGSLGGLIDVNVQGGLFAPVAQFDAGTLNNRFEIPQAAVQPGGTVRVIVDGGLVQVPAFSVSAAADAGGVGALAQGGSVLFDITNGALNTNDLYVTANATAYDGANAIGGAITLNANQNGTLFASYGALYTADARGGSGTIGGEGRGGSIGLTITEGRVAANSIGLSASGIGGSSNDAQGEFANAANGTGRGGTVTLNATGTGDPQGEFVAGLDALSLFVSAEGTGGTATFGEGTSCFSAACVPLAGGAGFGGGVGVNTSVQSFRASTVNLTADGYGGAAADDFSDTQKTGGAGGAATGGNAAFTVTGGAVQANEITITAGANANDLTGYGELGQGGRAFIGGRGGDARGGTATLTINAGTLGSYDDFLSGTGVRVAAEAGGGDGGFGAAVGGDNGRGGDGGSNVGGIARATIAGGSAAASLTISTRTEGGDGGGTFDAGYGAIGGLGGAGGSGTGGTTSFSMTGGTLSTADISVYGGGFGGLGGVGVQAGGAGGIGTGGNSALDVSAGRIIARTDEGGFTQFFSDVDTDGEGGDGGSGRIGGVGGDGLAGQSSFSSTIALDYNFLSVDADGEGGDGGGGDGPNGIGGAGGAGTAGRAQFTVTAPAPTSFAEAQITAGGQGGEGGYAPGPNTYAVGGSAVGGNASATINSAVTADNFVVVASGFGGGQIEDSEEGPGEVTLPVGGSGKGGSATLVIDGAGSLLLPTTNLVMAADGIGAPGTQTGGAGEGGSYTLRVLNGASFSPTGVRPQ